MGRRRTTCAKHASASSRRLSSFSDTPMPAIEPSGEVGRDNVSVFGEWLGLGSDAVAELAREQII